MGSLIFPNIHPVILFLTVNLWQSLFSR